MAQSPAPTQELHRAPRRVLVTGAAGLLGRATVAALARARIAVDALSLAFDDDVPHADRLITADARDVDAVAAAVGEADAVVHLAAIRHRDLGSPEQVYATNVLSTFTVLARAGEAKVRRVVIASSINAYGVPLNHHEPMPAYFPIDEAIPAELDDWYSLSKLSDELTLTMACSHWGMSGVAIRLPWISSGEELRRESDVQTRHPSTGMTVGWAWIHTDDAADAVVSALLADYSGAHVVGIAADETLVPYATDEMLDRFAPTVPRRAAFVGRAAPIDTSRARELFGFRPTRRLDLDLRQL